MSDDKKQKTEIEPKELTVEDLKKVIGGVAADSAKAECEDGNGSRVPGELE